MNKEQKTLAPCITRDVELGGLVVTQYGITCQYDWQETGTFSLQIGNMQEEYMTAIEADYFWGFADVFNTRTLTGALYAVFSKGDDVLIHEFTNTVMGYSHHRVFTLNAVKRVEKTYISVNNNLWVVLDKTQPDSFVGASIHISRCETQIYELSLSGVFMFPEYAHAGAFDRLPCTVDAVAGVFGYVRTGDTGELRFEAEGTEGVRYLEVGVGIEFDGIFRVQTGADNKVTAVFKYGDGLKIHVHPPIVGMEEDRPELSIYCPDIARSMYLTKRLFSSKIWLDENGVLCSEMGDPKPTEGAYWRFEQNNSGWNICEPENS